MQHLTISRANLFSGGARLCFAVLVIAASGLYARPAEHPAPGTSLVHFAEIDTGVFKGSKPKHDADFVFLQQHHVRYILELSFLPLLSRGERKKAHRFGMILITVHMNASPLAPSEKHVDEALCILRDTQFHPIYFHCEIGRDRTSLIAALYEMYFKQMPPERTWEAMKLYGFKDYWTLRGLKTYLEKHAARLRRAGTLHQHICACPGA